MLLSLSVLLLTQFCYREPHHLISIDLTTLLDFWLCLSSYNYRYMLFSSLLSASINASLITKSIIALFFTTFLLLFRLSISLSNFLLFLLLYSSAFLIIAIGKRYALVPSPSPSLSLSLFNCLRFICISVTAATKRSDWLIQIVYTGYIRRRHCYHYRPYLSSTWL